MPTTAAGIEGRLPEPHEFVDAAILVGGIHAAGGLRHVPEVVPKLRDIYAKTGKDPIAVAQAAETDPTVRQDILSINRDIPQAIAEEIAAKRPQDIKPESETESSAPTTPTAASDEGALQSAGSGTHIPIAEDKPVMPEGELSRAAAVPLSDVVQSLADALEVPIRTGKMGPSGRNAEGIYKVTPEVIRTRTANDVATVVHGDDIPSPADMCRGIFERIAREGRKFGLGLVLSSQRPSELSETVLSQCNSFLLHRITNDRDQDLISRLVPDSARGLLRELPSLPTRHCILLGIASKVPVLVEVKRMEDGQRPESDDPDFWKVWTNEAPRPIDWAKITKDWIGSSNDAVPPQEAK